MKPNPFLNKLGFSDNDRAVIIHTGVPMMDGILGMPLEHDNDHIGVAKKLLGELPVGITHFILHPSIDTPELRAIAPDWQVRVAN